MEETEFTHFITIFKNVRVDVISGDAGVDGGNVDPDPANWEW
jgi:hypothetical protein